MEDTKIQQQIVDKIKSSTNILVTVSRDPSVDELSAALGLTALLDKLDKHATAIFSGAIPPAITFLDPEKTFENTADSLRDFIIALNKEKADHLRYKVEGDVVKIFITPYRTTITGDDLEFSQGDYNVELVLALGVENQANLDVALEAHGRILHDATVATISAGTQVSSLGSIDWRDDAASSLSEMIMSIGELLKTDKPLIDDQIATALLTGIVASTDRFSNPKTTSKVMTMAAQLMAAGADQQLIAAKLQESHEIAPPPVVAGNSGETLINEGLSVKLGSESTLPENDNLSIDHSAPPSSNEVVIQPSAESTLPPDAASSTLPPETPVVVTPPNTSAVEPDLSQTTSTLAPTSTLGDTVQPVATTIEPSSGSMLSTASKQASEGVDSADQVDHGRVILSHSYLDPSASGASPINGATQADVVEKPVDIFAKPINDIAPEAPAQIAAQPQPAPESARDHDDARAAVDAALGGVLTGPASAETPFSLPPPPPLPDFSTLPPPLPDFSAPAPSLAEQPEKLGDIFAPQPAPVSQAPLQSSFEPPTLASLPPQPVGSVATDPGQFHIPGQ